MDIKFNIVRTAVMAKVEGLTVMLSEHNPGIPFETLWASAGDQGKLDLYYKEAISDLEDSLKRWIKQSSSQFDILATGKDYTITLRVPCNAAVVGRLNGLLANKIQDYFCHAILSYWLADLPEGAPVKPDYLDITSSDITAILDLLNTRDLDATAGARHDASDDSITDGDGFMLMQGKRIEDNDEVRPRTDRTDWGLPPHLPWGIERAACRTRHAED